ncbi:MAG: hypothetical protein JF589_00540, partial [Gemmatimonadetes bacterium]|nr:hypothetical protein [Gemmatimonadota bacterium]
MSRRRSGTARADTAPSLFDAASSASDVAPSEATSVDLYEEVGDTFPGASASAAIAVSTLTQTAKDVVEGAFPSLWVRGEVSDFKR